MHYTHTYIHNNNMVMVTQLEKRGTAVACYGNTQCGMGAVVSIEHMQDQGLCPTLRTHQCMKMINT